MEISFECKGLKQLCEKLERLKGIEKDPEIDKELGRGAAMMQGAVKMLTPKDTGNLRNKIFIDHKQLMVYTVETNVEYAMYVEYGTGLLGDPSVPHTSKESWVYYSDKLQRFVTTHGQKPAHMFSKGFQTMHKKVFDNIEKKVQVIIKRAGRN